MTNRLVPELPFPAYAFVPGRSPHPVSDPAGHSHGVPTAPAEELDLDRWSANKTYLYGLDLFNAGYYWESHVEWEKLWISCGRKGRAADFLKGLIKLAAAGVKHREGRADGVTSHARRAAELFRDVARSFPVDQDLYLGLRLTELIELADTVCRSGWPDTSPMLLPDTPPGPP